MEKAHPPLAFFSMQFFEVRYANSLFVFPSPFQPQYPIPSFQFFKISNVHKTDMRTNKESRKHHVIERESRFIGAGAALPVKAAGAPDPAVEFVKLGSDADADAAAASVPTKDAGTTIPAAPGVIVCPAITYAPAALGVMV